MDTDTQVNQEPISTPNNNGNSTINAASPFIHTNGTPHRNASPMSPLMTPSHSHRMLIFLKIILLQSMLL